MDMDDVKFAKYVRCLHLIKAMLPIKSKPLLESINDNEGPAEIALVHEAPRRVELRRPEAPAFRRDRLVVTVEEMQEFTVHLQQTHQSV